MTDKLKLTLKIISAALLILFFCPSFLVSCSGQDINVSGMNLLVGYSSDEIGRVTDPQILMVIFLALPIVALVFLFKKAADEKKNNLILGIIGAVEFVGWIIVKKCVQNWCQENYCSVSSKWGYVLTMLCSLAMTIICLGLYFGFISDGGINISGVNIQVGKGWNCPKCGARNEESSKFCTGCGAPKPVFKYCAFCGAANPEDNKFCVSCGKEFPEKPSVAEPVVAEPEVAEAPVVSEEDNKEE